MLPQLVGMSCAVCNQRIGSDIYGHFCTGCGNPIHNECGSPPRPVSNDDLLTVHESPKCPRCGCDPNTHVACHVRAVWLGHRARKEVEDERPLLEAYHSLRQQQLPLRICGIASQIVFVLALLFVALLANEDDQEGALICVAVPGGIAAMYLLLAARARKLARMATEEWDRITDEKELKRIEKGEPLE